jgi:hypothetical protein
MGYRRVMGFNWEPPLWTPKIHGVEQSMAYQGYGLRQPTQYNIEERWEINYSPEIEIGKAGSVDSLSVEGKFRSFA